ncbi:MAG: TRAP transporter small permease subunit [Rhodospirillales bacterium]
MSLNDPRRLPSGEASLPGWLSWPRQAIETVATALIVVMMLSTLAQVAFRYVFELSVPWTEELARILFVMAMLLTMGTAIRENENIIVDFLLRRASPRWRCAISVLFDAAILAFLFIWGRGALALISLNLGSTLVTLPFVSVGYLYACELFGVLLMALYVGIDLVTNALRFGGRLESTAS